MSLAVLLPVVQNDHRRDEVHDLAGRQQMQITAAVATSVSVDPVELQFALRRRANFVKVVGFHHGRRDVKNDRSAAQVHADGAFLLVVLHVPGAANRSRVYFSFPCEAFCRLLPAREALLSSSFEYHAFDQIEIENGNAPPSRRKSFPPEGKKFSTSMVLLRSHFETNG